MPLSTGLAQAGNEIPKWQLAKVFIAKFINEMCFPLSWASAGWEEENLHGSMPHIDRSIPGVCEGTDLFMGLFLLPAEIPLKEPLWSPRVGWFGPDIGCLCGRFWCGRSVLCVTRNKACRSQSCPPSAPLHARVQGGEEVLGAPTRSVGEPPLSPAFSIRVTKLWNGCPGGGGVSCCGCFPVQLTPGSTDWAQ